MTTVDLTSRLRPRLEHQLRSVLARHAKIEAHLHNRDRTVPQDWSEMAQFLENDEVLEALDEHARAEVDDIRVALHRMDEGTYGTCSNCGDPIRGQRLDALPLVRTCVSCAGQREQAGA